MIDPDGVGGAQCSGQGGWQVQAQHGQRLRHPLAQADRRAGVGLVQLAGQRLQVGLGVQGTRSQAAGMSRPRTRWVSRAWLTGRVSVAAAVRACRTCWVTRWCRARRATAATVVPAEVRPDLMLSPVLPARESSGCRPRPTGRAGRGLGRRSWLRRWCAGGAAPTRARRGAGRLPPPATTGPRSTRSPDNPPSNGSPSCSPCAPPQGGPSTKQSCRASPW